jgi:hypothetical protein
VEREQRRLHRVEGKMASSAPRRGRNQSYVTHDRKRGDRCSGPRTHRSCERVDDSSQRRRHAS